MSLSYSLHRYLTYNDVVDVSCRILVRDFKRQHIVLYCSLKVINSYRITSGLILLYDKALNVITIANGLVLN